LTSQQKGDLEKIPEEENFESLDRDEDLLPPTMARSISVPLNKG